ncbi:MAG: hypothetical protein JO056_10555 [Alphaproteobacteria bacterium]|jgi:hypothetical protein|nr:hypothetical protein [Alphaproteobacteria bacterium]
METVMHIEEPASRAARISEMLERQLIECNSVLATCLGSLAPAEAIDAWPWKRMLGLMKMSAQLASAISRVDHQGHSKNREK